MGPLDQCLTHNVICKDEKCECGAEQFHYESNDTCLICKFLHIFLFYFYYGNLSIFYILFFLSKHVSFSFIRCTYIVNHPMGVHDWLTHESNQRFTA